MRRQVVDVDLKAEEGHDYTDRPMKSEDEAMSQLAAMIFIVEVGVFHACACQNCLNGVVFMRCWKTD
jgi:hypothetical protein